MGIIMGITTGIIGGTTIGITMVTGTVGIITAIGDKSGWITD
jgi:hypothetical protein